MAKDTIWAGNVEIAAISLLFKTDIYTYAEQEKGLWKWSLIGNGQIFLIHLLISFISAISRLI